MTFVDSYWFLVTHYGEISVRQRFLVAVVAGVPLALLREAARALDRVL